ncbi:hypothetical protein HOD05_03025 [Candidatus Woesearchaeota archaeon]|jgi:hypothetical protein|nr:hypothetical protein [Candidatus Woesearchaeota archaeon]MBT4151346.1 hypothetical protein [Candidatus Woesearchaeota archaeon]MBT4247744.1 hypothetical protein [Candidatus Woesearchaeota archaeon]MBT4434168.1 hypothetical protein [Candidatus Woesearchaeota archaeon]MBT7332485.1 hypothetical protein [Candidatus Woesearchaeota archaeon]
MTINAYFTIPGQDDFTVNQPYIKLFKSLNLGDQINVFGEPYVVIGSSGGFSKKFGNFLAQSLSPKDEFVLTRESDCLVNFYTANAEQSKLGSERLTGNKYDLSDFCSIN